MRKSNRTPTGVNMQGLCECARKKWLKKNLMVPEVLESLNTFIYQQCFTTGMCTVGIQLRKCQTTDV